MAAPHDLFRAFDTVSANAVFPLPTDVSVSTVLKTWTEEAGYPVVTLNKLANGTIVVTQVGLVLVALQSSQGSDRTGQIKRGKHVDFRRSGSEQ